MAGAGSVGTSPSGLRLSLGFVAGFVATLTFLETGILVLHAAGMIAALPWPMAPVPPFGVPAVLSLAFWGGVWGIAFVSAEPLIARCPGGYWLGAILFGAIVPTLFAWFVVAPLKGLPLGNGFRVPGLFVGPVVNGLWGLGTGVFLAILPGTGHRPARDAAPKR